MTFGIILLLCWIAFTAMFYVAGSVVADTLGSLRQHSFVSADDPTQRFEDLLRSPDTRRMVSLAGAVFGLLLGLNLGLGLAVGLAVAGIGAFAPVGYLRRRERKRRELLDSQIIMTLTMIADAMRAGKTLPQAMESAAAALSPPMSQELSIVTRQLRVGIKPEDALRALAARVAIPDLKLAVKAMLVSIQTGANLPQAVRRIVDTITNRSRVEGKIRVLTTQGKWQGIILGLFPFFLLVGFWLMNPDYIGALFHTTIGNVILGVMFVLQASAMVVIRQILAVKV